MWCKGSPWPSPGMATLKSNFQPQDTTPAIDASISDGAIFVNMLKPDASNTLNDYAVKCFVIPLSHSSRIVGWAVCAAKSLKAQPRSRRWEGVKRFSKPLAPSQQQLWPDTLCAEQGPDGVLRMILAPELPSPAEHGWIESTLRKAPPKVSTWQHWIALPWGPQWGMQSMHWKLGKTFLFPYSFYAAHFCKFLFLSFLNIYKVVYIPEIQQCLITHTPIWVTTIRKEKENNRKIALVTCYITC